MLQYARVQIPGALFATVSSIVVVIVVSSLGAIAENRFPALLSLFYGPPIAGPNSPNKRHIQFAMRGAQNLKYNFSADDQPAMNRYNALDRQGVQQKAAEGDEKVQALLEFADTKTRTTVGELMQTRNLEFGGTFFRFGALGIFAAQFSGIAFSLLAIMAVLEADHRVASVTFVQFGIGLILLSAVLIVLILQIQLSVTQIQGIENLEDLMSDDDRILLNRIKGRWLYPTVTVKPKFYSVLRRYLVLLHAPIMLFNLVLFGLTFLCAALVTLLWPGTVKDWPGELPRAFLLLAIAAVVYIGAFWTALKALESLRDVLQPVFVGVVTAFGTVLVMYLINGSMNKNYAISSIGAALPASIATGFASSFWKSR
jgi:hypothetical protein